MNTRTTGTTLLLAALLTGCVMHPQVKLTGVDGRGGQPLNITDTRPAEQKRTELLSSVITACSYGIARLGDDQTQPDRLAYLGQRLSATRGDALAGKRIELREFSVYRNNQVKLRGGVMPNAEGVVIAVLRASECFGDMNTEGGYAVAENPGGENLAIVNIEIVVDGKPLRARAVEQARGTPAQFPAGHDVWSVAIATAVDRAVDQLAGQLDN